LLFNKGSKVEPRNIEYSKIIESFGFRLHRKLSSEVVALKRDFYAHEGPSYFNTDQRL